MSDLEEKWAVLEAQLKAYGYACATTSDGTVFIFSQGILESLVDQCKTNGRGVVTVLIQNQALLN